MNLPNNISRCRGEFQDHWQNKIEECPRRDECLRHVQIIFDETVSPPTGHIDTISHCVDDGRLSGFIPMTAYRGDDEGT